MLIVCFFSLDARVCFCFFFMKKFAGRKRIDLGGLKGE